MRQPLRQSEERFEIAFRLAPVPTFVASHDGFRILLANDAFLRESGYAHDAIVGREVGDLPLWADEKSGQELRTALKKEGRARDLRLQLRTAAGELVDVLVSAETVEMDGRSCVLVVASNTGKLDRTHVEVAAAIEAVMRDTDWFTDVVLEKLARMRRADQPGLETTGLAQLPSRARQVLDMVCQGHDDGVIAAAMEVSRNTVRNHITSLYRKTGVTSRSKLIVWARERGLTGRPR